MGLCWCGVLREFDFWYSGEDIAIFYISPYDYEVNLSEEYCVCEYRFTTDGESDLLLESALQSEVEALLDRVRLSGGLPSKAETCAMIEAVLTEVSIIHTDIKARQLRE